MNLKHIARDAAYLCLGTAAVLVEKGGDVARALVRKGAQTWHDNQDTIDDLTAKAKDLAAKAKEQLTRAAAPEVDAAQMSPEERAELRRQLDEADAQPVAPDAIFRTDEPLPDDEADEEAAVPAEEPDVTDAPASAAEEPDVPNAPAPDVASPIPDAPPAPTYTAAEPDQPDA